MKAEENRKEWCLLVFQRATAALESSGVEAVAAVTQPVDVPV